MLCSRTTTANQTHNPGKEGQLTFPLGREQAFGREHAAEALEVGGASDPQRSASGYHVLVLLDRSPGGAPPFADVKEEVRAELRRRSSERALRSYLDELRASADVRVRREAEGP